MTAQSKRPVLTAAMLAATWGLCLTLWLQWPFLAHDDRIDDDVCQHAYWMQQWTTDLSQDILAVYSVHSSPPAVRWFYVFIRKIMDPVFFTKVFPLFAVAASCFVIAATAGSLGGPWAAIIAGVLLSLHANWRANTWFGTANAGDFGPLLMVPLVSGLVLGRPLLVAGMLGLEALCYPPLFALNGLAVGLLCSGNVLRQWQKTCSASPSTSGMIRNRLVKLSRTMAHAHFRQLILPAITILGGCYVLLVFRQPSPFGPLAHGAQVQTMPEFGVHGRTKLFYPSLIDMITNYRSGLSLDGSTLWLTALAVCSLAVLKPRWRPPVGIRALLAAGCILYAIARSMMLRLYEPSRFFEFNLPLCALIIGSVGWGRWLHRTRTWRAALGLAALLGGTAWIYWEAVGHDGKQAGHPGLYYALSRLPDAGIIAGHPLYSDMIPVMVQRRVLVQHELAQPYIPGFYLQIKQRLVDFFTAYFSRDPIIVQEYLRHCGATHLLVCRYHFSEVYRLNGEQDWDRRVGKYYFSPYEELITQLLAQPGTPILAKEPDHGVIFADDEFYLIDIKEFLE